MAKAVCVRRWGRNKLRCYAGHCDPDSNTHSDAQKMQPQENVCQNAHAISPNDAAMTFALCCIGDKHRRKPEAA